MMVELNNLPWPPSVNHYWKMKSCYLSGSGKKYRKAVIDLVPKMRMLTGSLAVHVDIFPPDCKRRDVDNILKALLDALDHANVYADDSQISELSVKRMPPVAGGRVNVTIRKDEREWDI